MGFRAKTIKSILSKKMNSWIQSIDDDELRKDVTRDTIITGGSIASMLLGEPVNDYDVYFATRETTIKVAEYYLKNFKEKQSDGIARAMFVDTSKEDRVSVVIKSAGIASEEGTAKPYEYFEMREEGVAGEYVGEVMNDPGEIEDLYQTTEEATHEVAGDDATYRPVFLSTNAITLSGRIQIITRFYGEPDVIHENYDFEHCKNWYRFRDNHLELRQNSLQALLARELVYSGSKYPVCSIIRLRKFIKRGWKVNAGQILKMVMQVSELDLNNIEVLQDQLTGVDAAYFCELLSMAKIKGGDRIETAYLVEIINRMF